MDKIHSERIDQLDRIIEQLDKAVKEYEIKINELRYEKELILNYTLSQLLYWCNKTAEDHHTIYLLDRQNNNYYLITNGKQQCSPPPKISCFKKKIQNTTKTNIFDDHEFLFRKKSGEFDLVYNDNNYKIIVHSEKGIKKNKREEIILSIQTMIDNNEFIYCDF